MNTVYNTKFFNAQAGGSSRSASVVIPLLLSLDPTIQSAVDIGCGIGTWVAELQRHGVQAWGIDGDYVDAALLQIPADRFDRFNLFERIALGRRFDLAMSLEVAEHLPRTRAESFVADLVALAPCVLFSAAIPGQGGANHVNEQLLSYWAEHFAAHGYTPVDSIRPRIWDNDNVEFWYRQNIMIFAAPGHPILTTGPRSALDYVHPQLYMSGTPQRNGPKALIRAFPKALWRSIQNRLTSQV